VLKERSFALEEIQEWDVEMVGDWLARDVVLPQYKQARRLLSAETSLERFSSAA
jgi:hypothetical protein